MVKRIKKYSRKRERQRGGSIHTIEIVNHGNTPKGQAMNKVEATLAINKLKMNIYKNNKYEKKDLKLLILKLIN